MDSNIDDLPQLVDTGAGFTVFYKERFLYSKRVPNRQIDVIISSIEHSIHSKEKTLFLFTSPLLGYGVVKLLSILPRSSFLFFLECDNNLGKIFEEFYSKIPRKNNVTYLLSSNIMKILEKIETLTSFNFKNVLLIKGSAGHNLYENFYNNVLKSIEDATSTFWKNKITLIGMGRLYSRNLFKVLNLIKNDANGRFFTLQKEYVKKPILVLGAGPSFDFSYPFIKKHRKDFFLLAVDAILPSLSDLDVAPDAVLLLEGQYWIMSAFLASKYRNIPLFASLTSSVNVLQLICSNIFLYITPYTQFTFLEKLKIAIPNLPFFEGLGSVGLLALQIALFIAKKGVPIFHTGLDFSWQKGFSHARSSNSVKNILISSNRISPLYKGIAVFPSQCSKVEGKKGETLSTTPILQSYAKLYKNNFALNTNIFDIGEVGMNLTTHIMKEDSVIEYINSSPLPLHSSEEEKTAKEREEKVNANSIQSLLHSQLLSLNTLKNMLTGQVPFDEKKAAEILRNCSYLYLHFPDYIDVNKINTKDISFLKRIRIEVEYFLKIMG